jgi:hypothetical protein
MATKNKTWQISWGGGSLDFIDAPNAVAAIKKCVDDWGINTEEITEFEVIQVIGFSKRYKIEFPPKEFIIKEVK